MLPPGFQIARPHALLGAHVHRYVEIRLTALPGEAVLHPVSAHADPVLFLHLSGNASYGFGDAPATERFPSSGIVGPLPSASVTRYEGAVHGFAVCFSPWGMRALLGMWGDELANRTTSLDEAASASVRLLLRDWVDRLAEAPDFAARRACADAFLIGRLRDASPLPLAVRPALQLIQHTSGMLPVAEVARCVETPVSTLRRHLIAVTGIPPKLHAQVTRFRHACSFLHAQPGATWSDVVGRFGYTDQSHFIREHRRFSGSRPGDFDSNDRFIDRSLGLGDDLPPG